MFENLKIKTNSSRKPVSGQVVKFTQQYFQQDAKDKIVTITEFCDNFSDMYAMVKIIHYN